ncbi:DNA recombination and repair protein RecF [Desulfurella amilsii]|uniref:DNA recombination and repair protein RecF n=1 Tax=Desulfurella amilsii TaxID=1562698 RepID=A0A1X4XXU4_9BACT|nr:AAA family ATPase [Desulfurella amilsii]OSS42356.1 DNA recombination and repair protein RecF [Desulfurella amilsii]
MYLDSISISNFRNYKYFTKTFSPQINIIKGTNASGKTNLLDSIYILLNSHSFIKKNYMNKYNESIIKGTIKKEITYNITVTLGKNKKSQINSKTHTLKDFKLIFPSVIFSIKDFFNFNEKKYILSLIDKFSFIENPNIIENIINTLKQLKLKHILFEKKDFNTIKIINKNITTNMQTIQRKRNSSIQAINSYLQNQNIIPKKIQIQYKPLSFDEKIANLEIQTKHNIFTPYKDSIEILLDENNIFSYSSLGEKKMILFSLIMSLVEHYNNLNKAPIILIDDLEGDISNTNLQKMIEKIILLNNQVFITTLENINIKNANVIALSGGI